MTIHHQRRQLVARLGPDFERDYAGKLARGESLNLPRALAMAFGGRGPEFRRAHTELIAELERLAAEGQG